MSHQTFNSISIPLVCALMLLSVPSDGAAQTACLQPAQGVPPTYTPPVWWGASPSSTSYDDPRWVGSWNQPVEDGTSEHGRFRAMNDGSNLYLSWFVAYDPAQFNTTLGTDVTDNTVWVGFQKNGSMSGTILRMNLASVTAGDAQNVNTVMMTTSNNGASWTAVPDPLPTWYTESARRWIWNDPGSGGVVWAIQVRVPISNAGIGSGLDLGTDFRLWYEAKVPTPSSGVVNWMHWPTTAAYVSGFGTEIYPAPSSYGNAHRSSGLSDVTCTNGVSISVSDIGTTNVPPYQVNVSANSPYPVNTFFARPLNNTGLTIGQNKITARFRIANWGSVIGAGATWEDIPGGGAVPNGSQIPGGPQPATFYPIQFGHAFQPGEPLYDGIIAGTKNRDQCLLVELSGPGITFISSSARRNLQFVGGSTVDRSADISVEGLPPIAGGRDVYLHVQKYLMPEIAGPGDTLVDTTQVLHPQPGLAVAPQRRPAMSMRQYIRFIPSYRVHVYHTTGDTLTSHGVKHPLLEPQSSFGYFVLHQGPLQGWHSILEGADRISGTDWYKMRNVTGVAKIRTRVQAQVHGEPPITPSGGGGHGGGICDRLKGSSGAKVGLVVGLIGLLIHLPTRRRKRRGA